MAKFLFGKSQLMHELRRTVNQVARSDLPVFLEGETGTGKTLLAGLIHELDKGPDGLLQRLDCGTIPPSLVESELFGHEKGAFTGATESKSGLFELACEGTVFLDEIENLELPLQAKLLTVVDEKKFRRIGGKDELRACFRIISASNANILRRVQQGTFREDLYYRLVGSRIYIPPLRQRRADILELADFFLLQFNKSYRTRKRLAVEVKPLLRHQSWPGNVRQLKQKLLEAFVKAEKDEIRPEHFSLDMNIDFIFQDSQQRNLSLAQLEQRYIEFVLQREDFNKTRAARVLGIGTNTLYRKIEKYGIQEREK